MGEATTDPRKENKQKLDELTKEVSELNKSVVALLKAMKQLEEDQDEIYMPEGEFNGIKFES